MSDLHKPLSLLSISLADIQAIGLSEMNKVIDENEAQAVFAHVQNSLVMHISLIAWIKSCIQVLEKETAFRTWFQQVDDSVWGICGLSLHDLPDIDYYALFDVGTKPVNAAQIVLSNAGWPQQV